MVFKLSYYHDWFFRNTYEAHTSLLLVAISLNIIYFNYNIKVHCMISMDANRQIILFSMFCVALALKEQYIQDVVDNLVWDASTYM